MARKRKRSGRGRFNLRMAPIGAGLYAAHTLGWFHAGTSLMNGNIRQAAAHIKSGFTAQNVLMAGGAVVATKLAREAFGPCNVAKFGRVNISMF